MHNTLTAPTFTDYCNKSIKTLFLDKASWQNMGGLGKRRIHEHCMDKGVVDNLQIHLILLSGNTIFYNSFMSGFHTGFFPGRGQRRCMQRAHMHVSVPTGGGLEIPVLPPPCPPSPPKPPCETVLLCSSFFFTTPSVCFCH